MRAFILIALALPATASAQTAAPDAPPPSGAIFRGEQGYIPLTNGQRAAAVGDVLTIVLAERTQGVSSNSAGLDRDGGIGLSPPTTGPLAIFSASDARAGANTTFSGTGQSAQANALSGEITARIVAVFPNGTMQVEGEKHMRINRGDETVKVSGLVRLADIGQDNRVLSTRLANPTIEYSGRGEIARASRQGWLQRFFTRISPF